MPARLKAKKQKGSLGPVDSLVWRELGGFDQIFGPARRMDDLVEVYRDGKRRRVPYRIIGYDEYEGFIEANLREDGRWYDF